MPNGKTIVIKMRFMNRDNIKMVRQRKQRRDDGWFSDKNNRNHDDISSLDVNLDTQMSATDHVRFAYTAWR
ncbi:hypothetical protein DPMN_050765 [Dreissena polymorpha]|uniref:Uncharacterized protein n=1 Tax=Dreissena polymorpha TaxID=45954 RepID=A0A9D4CGR8_DREPO|nr:hypothetical protein DPMN_050765 [Dreissena polymorpha]